MSGTGQDANAGTIPVRDAHRFDEAALARWMESHVAGFAGPIQVEQFKGGQSNPTYKLTTPGRTYVLRRKPPGELLRSAHAVEREARVLTALGRAGYPVAHVHGLCIDDAVIGSWFYVMDMVEGRIFWDAAFPEIHKDERAAYFAAMNATLAQLHRFDPETVGLGDYGRPGNYFERQIARRNRSRAEQVPEAGRSRRMSLGACKRPFECGARFPESPFLLVCKAQDVLGGRKLRIEVGDAKRLFYGIVVLPGDEEVPCHLHADDKRQRVPILRLPDLRHGLLEATGGRE